MAIVIDTQIECHQQHVWSDAASLIKLISTEFGSKEKKTAPDSSRCHSNNTSRSFSSKTSGFLQDAMPSICSSSVEHNQRTCSVDESIVSHGNFSSASVGGGASVAHLVVNEGYLSGWIRKFSPYYGTGWQKRYFCLLEKDASLAYWKSVPEYADEQPTGSINLAHVRSVELEGGLGLVLRAFARDYQLLFNSPSEKDLWYNRILVLFRQAKKRMDEKSSDELANKFAAWANVQQQKSSSSLSTVFRLLRQKHIQIEEFSEDMGPTTDQTDIKRRLLQYFSLYIPLQKAFKKHSSQSIKREVPLEYHIPDIASCDFESSSVYSYAFATNVYHLHCSRPYDYREEDYENDIEGTCDQQGSQMHQQAIDTNSSDRCPHLSFSYDGNRMTSNEYCVPCYDAEAASSSFSGTQTKQKNGANSTSFDYSVSTALTTALHLRSNSTMRNRQRKRCSCANGSLTSGTTATCIALFTRPLKRSASLDSFHAETLRRVRVPSQIKNGSDTNDSSVPTKETSYQEVLRDLLGLRWNQASTWRLGLRRDRSRSIDNSCLSVPRRRLQLFQSSKPLFPNFMGLIHVTFPKIEFGLLQEGHYSLRPLTPGETLLPYVTKNDLPTVTVDSELASQVLRRSVCGCVDDLVSARQLCLDLDGISRFTDEMAVGRIESRERQRLATVLYERSSPSPMCPFVECLTTPPEVNVGMNDLNDNSPSPPHSLHSDRSLQHRSKSTCSRYPQPCYRRCSTQGLVSQNVCPTKVSTVLHSEQIIVVRSNEEQFLDNVIIGHLYVGFGSPRYSAYIAVLISGSAIGSGKCFDIHSASFLSDDIELLNQISSNSILLYSLDVVRWPLPAILPSRETPPEPVHVIDLRKCHKLSRIHETESGFEWLCRETRMVPRRFHGGTKKETRLISFRARTEREANTFRQSMVSSKLSSLPEIQRSRIIRANYKGRRWRTSCPDK